MQTKENKEKLISIDPSINNLGLAVSDIKSRTVIMHKLLHPEVNKRENEYDKAFSMFLQVKHWITAYGVTRVIMEVPDQWAVAGFQARETGSMTKLAFVCGLLYGLKEQLGEFKLVLPREWKGQLKKEVMVNRLRDHYLKQQIDLAKLDSNVADAIGIGHFYLWGRV